jgi:5-methyltetrahydrofolate--homocysteine methyltransferase
MRICCAGNRSRNPDPRRCHGHDDPAPWLDEADYRGERFADWPSDLKGNNDLLVLTRPDVIADIHGQYLEAGADIIETNTFNATRIAMADYGMEELAYEINVAAARVAREAGGHYPTARQAALRRRRARPDQPYRVDLAGRQRPGLPQRRLRHPGHGLCRVHAWLIEGGADILLIETMFDTLNAKAAIFAVKQVFDEDGVELPIMISGTITDQSGRTLTGQTTEAFYNSLRHAEPISIGLNCALGPAELRPMSRSSRVSPSAASRRIPTPACPMSSAATTSGRTTWPSRSPSGRASGFLNIVGGLLRHHAGPHPRDRRGGRWNCPAPRRPPSQPACRLSGLEPLQHRRRERCSSTSASAPTSPARRASSG